MKTQLTTLLLSSLFLGICSSSELDEADTAFLKQAAASGMAEVKMANIGKTKAARADVKEFSEMIATDHTKVNAELKTLAASNGVDLPTEIDGKHVAMCAALDECSPADFDREFLSAMVTGHQKGVARYDQAANKATDTDVKAFAAKTLPALKAHLEKAKKLGGKSVAATTTHETDADNTARNAEDRKNGKATAQDQANNKNDTELTAQIRKDIMADKDLSVNAHNEPAGNLRTQNTKTT